MGFLAACSPAPVATTPPASNRHHHRDPSPPPPFATNAPPAPLPSKKQQQAGKLPSSSPSSSCDTSTQEHPGGLFLSVRTQELPEKSPPAPQFSPFRGLGRSSFLVNRSRSRPRSLSVPETQPHCYDEELPIEARGNLESVPNKFKLLRVLCIWNLDYAALPDEIGKLIHLIYLSIEYSKILVLPKSIRSLRNLLYLIYTTTDVVEVPDGLVGNMENLRGLTLPLSIKRGSLSRLGLNAPKNLQLLMNGVGQWMTKELPTLSTTVHTLEIRNIQKKEEMEALCQCSCIREDSLHRLVLGFDGSMSLEKALEFDLEKLRGCTTLWELVLDFQLASNCNGINIQFPPNLVRLSLYRSAIKERDDLMNVLGELSKLKELNLRQDSYLGTKLNCTNSGFQQLQTLSLEWLENLEELRMEEGAMARLRNLCIEKCPKLKRLPESIRSITTLKELKITRMPEEFCRRIGYKGSTSEAEDSYIIQHIPTVIVSVGS